MTTSSLTEALGWTLLHSLWQAALVAFVFYVACQLTRRPTYRYGVAIGAMFFIVGWSAYTFMDLYVPDASSPFTTVHSDPAPRVLPPFVSSPSLPTPHASWANQAVAIVRPYVGLVVAAWLLGALVMSVRLAGGLWYLFRLKRRYTLPLPAWEATTATLTSRLRLNRRVAVVASELAKVPMVVGYWKPVILLPVSLMSSLPAEQIEAIIAHELAHVRRLDYWVNVLQSLIETLFFYHPAVWWISSIAREEREKCCDDLAVSVCGDPLTYAKALAEAETLQHTPSTLTLAFAQRRSQLLTRIERLVHPSSLSLSPTVKLLPLLLVLLTISYLAVGNPFARHDDKPWLENGMNVISSPRSLPSAASDTTQPQQEKTEEDGWQGSSRARALAPPPPDTIPTIEEAPPSASPQGYFFYTDDSTDVTVDLNEVATTLDAVDDVFFFHFDDEDFPGSFFHAPVSPHDTFPAFLWNDSLWLESVDELSAQMGSFSEELQGYLTDSVDTDVLQEQLGDVQRELSRLQAELGATLQRSLNEERAEAWQRRLHAEQKRMQREIERATERSREYRQRMQEQRQRTLERKREARAQARQRVRSTRNLGNTVNRLEQALLADGLVKKGKRYRFELKPKGLYVNRKKQEDELASKYRDLLNVSESTNFSITRTAE